MSRAPMEYQSPAFSVSCFSSYPLLEEAYPIDATVSGSIPKLGRLALERNQEFRYRGPDYHEGSDDQTQSLVRCERRYTP